MDALGYRPSVGARGMRGATYTIGVSSLDPHNPFFAMLLEGVVAEMDDAGYRVLVTIEGAHGGDELETARALVDRQMDGLILITPCLPTAELELLAATVPIVLLGRHGEGDAYDSVASDDAPGSRLAVQHLVERGHRRIVYHSQPVRAPGLPELFREAGYREAMAEHGLRPDVVEGSWTQQGGEALAELIFARRRRPTAVHAGADVAAFGVLTHLWHHDLSAPDDLAVAGCDDTPVGGDDPDRPDLGRPAGDRDGSRGRASAAGADQPSECRDAHDVPAPSRGAHVDLTLGAGQPPTLDGRV